MEKSFESSIHPSEPSEKHPLGQSPIELKSSLNEIKRLDRVFNACDNLVRLIQEEMHTYETLLSDDTSGRIPTLIFSEIVNKVRADKGLAPAETYFIAAGRFTASSKQLHKLDEFLAGKPQIGRTLVVSENIDTGGSVIALAELLEKAKVDYKIAVLSAIDHIETYRKSDELKKVAQLYDSGRLIIGEQRSYAGHAFNDKKFSGVMKGEPGVSAHPLINPESGKNDVGAVRRDAKVISEWLYNRHFKK